MTVQAILVPSSSTGNKLEFCNAFKPCFFVPLQKKQMKRRNSHLILLIPILFTACHNSSLIETLDYIDSLCNEQQQEVGNLIRHTLSSVVLNSPSEVFERFQNAAKGRGRIKDDIEWEELAATLDLQYPHFITSVYERWPLIKPDELHVVCLMKMGLNNAQIMNVTEQPKTSVYRRIRKIRQNLDDLIKTQT